MIKNVLNINQDAPAIRYKYTGSVFFLGPSYSAMDMFYDKSELIDQWIFTKKNTGFGPPECKTPINI